RRVSMRYGNGYATTCVQGSLQLGMPSDRSRALKYLRVQIPVTLLREQKPEVVADKILTVKNKKVKVGTTTFHIESCTQTPQKQYQLKMTATEENLEGPNDYSWLNTLYRRIELQDEKGNKYANAGSSWSHSAANHISATFNFNSPGNAGPPTKMVYVVWKT